MHKRILLLLTLLCLPLFALTEGFSPLTYAKEELKRLQDRLKEYERMYIDIKTIRLGINENTQMSHFDREELGHFNNLQADNRKQMIMRLKTDILEKKAEIQKLEKSARLEKKAGKATNQGSKPPSRLRSPSRSPSRSRTQSAAQ